MKIEYLLIKKQNDFCQTTEQFINLMQTNARLKITSDKISFMNDNFDYTIKQYGVDNKHKETVFYLQVVSNAEPNDDIASKLESFDTLLRRINLEYGENFIINTIWDDVSTYYTSRLYPQIIEVENLLRKIIYRFMIKISGSEWFRYNVPDEVKSSISKTLEKNNINETNVYEDQLYYADFIQLGLFFFCKYTLKPLDQNAIQRIKEVLSEDKEKVSSLLEDYEAKSNWERYFSDKIAVEGLSEKWRKLYDFRNQVAHSKRMKKAEHQEALNLINELKPAFENCIDHIDDIQMNDEETEAAQDVATETIGANQAYFHDRPGLLPAITIMGKALGTVSTDFGGIESGLNQFGSLICKPGLNDTSVLGPIGNSIIFNDPVGQNLGRGIMTISSSVGQALGNSIISRSNPSFYYVCPPKQEDVSQTSHEDK